MCMGMSVCWFFVFFLHAYICCWHKLVKVGIFRSMKQVASENKFGKI